MEWVDLVYGAIGGGIIVAVREALRWRVRGRRISRTPTMSPDQTYCAVITDDGREVHSRNVMAPFRPTLRCKIKGIHVACDFVRMDKRGRFLYEVVE